MEPLVWNKRTGNLVGGHQRFKILLARGDKQIQCSVVDLPLAQEKPLNLALNKIQGDWDDVKLPQLLNELIALPNVDVSLTGFGDPEITMLLDGLTLIDGGDEDDEFDVAGELAAIDKPVTKPGELIELGPHRLLCGDCTKPENIERLLGDNEVQMIFTDPPYGIAYKAIKDRAKVSGDSLTELRQLLRAFTPIPCPAKYVCGHWKTFREYVEVLGMPKTLIVWNKSQQLNRIMKGHNFHLYNPRHELIYYYGSQKHKAGIYEENVWNVPNEVKLDHPTIKPVRLCVRAIRNSSNVGDVVLDLFLGSGSTLIAAERLRRVCVGIELEPRYCDVIRQRYERTRAFSMEASR